MASTTDRKVSGRYVAGKPRTVRFSTATGTRETLCLTDLVREMMASRITGTGGTGWTASELARQIGIAPSTLHGITNGDREPNLTHLERLCALANSTVLEVLFATTTFASTEVRAQIERGENPFAEMRLRGNLTDAQLEQVGRVAELAAVTDNVEWLVNLIVEAGAVLAQIKRS